MNTRSPLHERECDPYHVREPSYPGTTAHNLDESLLLRISTSKTEPNAQTTAFFTANDQMALPDRTYQKLADEGITGSTDLIDFTAESIKEIASTLRRPNTRDPDPDPNAEPFPRLPSS